MLPISLWYLGEMPTLIIFVLLYIHPMDDMVLSNSVLYRPGGQDPSRNLTFTERGLRSIFACWSSQVPHSCSEGFPEGKYWPIQTEDFLRPSVRPFVRHAHTTPPGF